MDPDCFGPAASALRGVLIPLVGMGIVFSLLSQSILILVGPIVGVPLLWLLSGQTGDGPNTYVPPKPFHSRDDPSG